MFDKILTLLQDLKKRINPSNEEEKDLIDQILYLEYKKIKNGMLKKQIEDLIAKNEPIIIDLPQKKKFKEYILGIDVGGSTFKMNLSKNTSKNIVKSEKSTVVENHEGNAPGKRKNKKDDKPGKNETENVVKGSTIDSIVIPLGAPVETNVGEFIDKRIEEICQKNGISPMNCDCAVSFSYPIENITENQIKILRFVKNYQFERDTEIVMKYAPKFIYNDSVAVLLSNMRDNMFNVVFICGTGVNCAFVKNKKLVNMELGIMKFQGVTVDQLLGGINCMESKLPNLSLHHPRVQNRIALKIKLLQEFISAIVEKEWDGKQKLNMIINGSMFESGSEMILALEEKFKTRVNYSREGTVNYYEKLVK